MSLQMNTPRAMALQESILRELAVKGYGTENDTVMSEYITIMLINSKTAEQITSELTDLIGSEYDPNFTTWLFAEAASPSLPGEPSTSTAPTATTSASTSVVAGPPPISPNSSPTHGASTSSRAPPSGPRSSALLQNALSGLGQKRSLSARSPSPSHDSAANKARRISELPDRPRAMREDGATEKEKDDNNNIIIPNQPSTRTLRDRISGFHHRPQQQQSQHQPSIDMVQAQIDAVTQNNRTLPIAHHSGFVPDPNIGMMNPAMMGLPMNMNPMALQEMMAANLAMMAQMGQMAVAMGVPNPLGQQGFNNGFSQNHIQQHGEAGRGRRGGARGGRGGPTNYHTNGASGHGQDQSHLNPNVPPFTPSSSTPNHIDQSNNPPPRGRAPAPNTSLKNLRPTSTQLCKFTVSCTNPTCPYSHPSPVANSQTGLVLTDEFCENGLECKDADCTKGHASPAAINASAGPVANGVPTHHVPRPAAPPRPAMKHPAVALQKIPCKFGVSCSRPNCPFLHPTTASKPCKFGKTCTRPDCIFTHPPGRTLASSGGIWRDEKDDAVSIEFTNRYNKTVDFRKLANGKNEVKKEAENGDESKEKGKAEVDGGETKEDEKSSTAEAIAVP